MPATAHRSAPTTHANRRSWRALSILAGGAATLVLATGSSALAEDPIGDNLDPFGARLTCQGQIPTIVAGPDSLFVQGTAGDDVILAQGGKHFIASAGGDDLICTDGPEGDRVLAYTGNDRVYTGSGPDKIEGSTGNDIMSSGGGDDTMIGQDGNDGAYGGSGKDWCFNAAAHSCGRMIRK